MNEVTWTIYHDAGDLYVARKIVGGHPTGETIAHKDADRLRGLLMQAGYTCLNDHSDNPNMEMWL